MEKRLFLKAGILKCRKGNTHWPLSRAITETPTVQEGSVPPIDYRSKVVLFSLSHTEVQFFCRTPMKLLLTKCIFTKRSASFFLHEKGLCLKGDVGFGPLSEIDSSRFCPDIMGPFSYLPFLQCRHGILSMGHTVTGSLSVNGEIIDFTGGTGYLGNGQRGISFPGAWLWTQCNQFPSGARMMLATATVPLGPLRIQGIIGVVMLDGQEYRLATYNGARLKKILCQQGVTEIEVANRKHLLRVRLTNYEGQSLLAPMNGAMDRPLRESISCDMRLSLYERGALLLDEQGKKTPVSSVRKSLRKKSRPFPKRHWNKEAPKNPDDFLLFP